MLDAPPSTRDEVTSGPPVWTDGDAAAPETRWLDHLSWGALAGLGFLIYEITARPTFGVAVVCLKFGWTDFQTAWWLWRRDPQIGRGRTCLWFYLAAGLWKITVAAFLITGCLLALVTVLGRKQPEEIRQLGLTAAAGISLLAIIPLIGVLHARWYRVKVWMDGSVSQSRRADQWPPRATGFNTLSGLLFPAMAVPTLGAAILAFHFGGPIAVPVAVFAVGVAVWALFHGVTAATPQQCWNDEPARSTLRPP